MSTKLDPLVSEFETTEEEVAYDHWFRAKVEKAINSPHPPVPHDEAMARVRQTVETGRQRRRSA